MHYLPRTFLAALLGAGFAVALATAPAAAQGQVPILGGPAPEAADQTLGMALMTGLVNGLSGTVDEDRSAGLVSVNHTSVGNYDVVFRRNIYNCASTITPVNASRIATISYYVATNTGYRVLIQDLAGNAANASFFIVVMCPR